jgi:hypothetical protein
MLEFLNARHPQALPRLRADLAREAGGAAADQPATPAPSDPADTASPGAEDIAGPVAAPAHKLA